MGVNIEEKILEVTLLVLIESQKHTNLNDKIPRSYIGGDGMN